jgi:hypothetical protein
MVSSRLRWIVAQQDLIDQADSNMFGSVPIAKIRVPTLTQNPRPEDADSVSPRLEFCRAQVRLYLSSRNI